MHDLDRRSDALLGEELVDAGGEALELVLGNLNINVRVGADRVSPDVEIEVLDEAVQLGSAVASWNAQNLDTVVAHGVVMDGHCDGGQGQSEEGEDSCKLHFVGRGSSVARREERATSNVKIAGRLYIFSMYSGHAWCHETKQCDNR